VRVKEEDISKNEFQTWFGYNEFVVVPFGLTNELTIFMSLMNGVFRKYLRNLCKSFLATFLCIPIMKRSMKST